MNSVDSGRNVRQHHTSCTLLGIISLLHAVHTSSGYLDLFYVHCTDQITVRLLRHYKLQVLWHRSATTGTFNRQCHSEILSCLTLSWYIISGLSEFKALFQPLEPLLSLGLHADFWVLRKLRKGLVASASSSLCLSVCLSVCLYVLRN